MRWVLTFLGMAAFFGLGVEFLGHLRHDGFSLLSAAAQGTLFAAPMTAFTYYQEKRKLK